MGCGKDTKSVFSGVTFAIFVALATKQDEKELLDRFFVKMKTVVSSDVIKDRQELELSYKNPRRFDHKKLFPNSNWELDKWDKEDTIGFLSSVGVLIFIIFLLKFIISLGG